MVKAEVLRGKTGQRLPAKHLNLGEGTERTPPTAAKEPTVARLQSQTRYSHVVEATIAFLTGGQMMDPFKIRETNKFSL